MALTLWEDPVFRDMMVIPTHRRPITLMDKLLKRDQSILQRFMREFPRDLDMVPFHFGSMDDEMRRFANDMDRFRRTNMYSLFPRESVRARDVVSLMAPDHVVLDQDGGKKFQVRVDVSKFKPEEIEVKAKDKYLTIHAKHQEESEGAKSYAEYHQQYMLPSAVEPSTLESILSDEGILTIEAPMKALEDAKEERRIPIKNAVN